MLQKKISFIFTRLNEAFANLSNKAEGAGSKPPAATTSPQTSVPPVRDGGARARALYLQAKRAYDKTDYWETIQFCREAIEIVSDRAEYFYLLARALARNVSWRKEAEENLRIANRLDPMKVEYILALGEIYRREGLEVRARKMFEQARGLDPDCELPKEG